MVRRLAFVPPLLAALALACGDSGGSADTSLPLPDRDDGGEAGVEAGLEGGAPDANAPACDPTKPFGQPVAIAELNTADDDVLTDMSADELVAYVATNHGVTGSHLFFATRTSRTGTFGALQTLFPAGAFDDWNVAISPDALTAVVSSTRPGSNASDLYVATRPNALSSFGVLGVAGTLSSPQDDQGPKFSADGKTLYFDSSRTGARDLYRATVGSTGFGQPQAITELNSSDLDAIPVVSQDELTIYFTSLRAPTTDGDIWVAKRASRTDPFGKPTPVTEVNSPAGVDAPALISADGCRLYLTSSRNGGHYDVYVATRPR